LFYLSSPSIFILQVYHPFPGPCRKRREKPRGRGDLGGKEKNRREKKDWKTVQKEREGMQWKMEQSLRTSNKKKSTRERRREMG
jgi:hypothetical protein